MVPFDTHVMWRHMRMYLFQYLRDLIKWNVKFLIKFVVCCRHMQVAKVNVNMSVEAVVHMILSKNARHCNDYQPTRHSPLVSACRVERAPSDGICCVSQRASIATSPQMSAQRWRCARQLLRMLSTRQVSSGRSGERDHHITLSHAARAAFLECRPSLHVEKFRTNSRSVIARDIDQHLETRALDVCINSAARRQCARRDRLVDVFIENLEQYDNTNRCECRNKGSVRR